MGESIPDESLVAAHPELMPELAEQLRHVRLFRAACRQVEHVNRERQATSSRPDEVIVKDSAPRGLHVRCPHCRTPVELPVEGHVTDITCNSCGGHFSLAPDDADALGPAIGTTVGRFELTELLGTGSFGRVWMARDSELKRDVAIKIPRRGGLDAAETEQFMREARAAAQLHHPNIVGIHEVGRDGETVYIVNDLLRGVTLCDYAIGQRPSVWESAVLCMRIAQALDHAHQAGVVHRDLKPGNIIVDRRGEPHITDFGLARRDVGEVTITTDGQILGTPAYMSPEQAQGEAHDVNHSSDIYSLGVILFELLTGELPFRGNAPMLIYQVIHDIAPSPRQLNHRVPTDLETICLKCLEKGRARRYQSAKDVADELDRFLKGEPIRARPMSLLARGCRWCGRNPLAAAVVALLVFLAVAGSLVAASQASLRRRADWMAAQQNAARREAEKSRVETYRQLYAADMKVSLQAWDAGDVQRVEQLLARYVSPPGREDLRGFEWYHLWQLWHESQTVPNLPVTNAVGSVAFAPDGVTLAVASDNSVHLWDVTTRSKVAVLSGHPDQVTSVAFSGDGNTLATGSRDGMVKLWDIASRQELTSLAGNGNGVVCLAFSPRAEILAIACDGALLKLWDVTNGEEPRSFKWPRLILSLALSPNRPTLATANWAGGVTLWSTEQDQELYTLQAHTAHATAVAFSPDGNILATGGNDAAVKLWDSASGQSLGTLKGHLARVRCVAFSPDGKTLASGGEDGTIKLWAPADRAEITTLRGHCAPVTCVAFGRDGHTLASGSDDKSVKLWNLLAQRNPLVLRGHDHLVETAVFWHREIRSKRGVPWSSGTHRPGRRGRPSKAMLPGSVVWRFPPRRTCWRLPAPITA
jgi:WD40 repeat protein